MAVKRKKSKRHKAPVLPAAEDAEEDQELLTVRGASTAKSTADQKTWACDICPRSFVASQVVNTGSRRYPRYRCKPCHNAAKALDRASKSKNAAAQELGRKQHARNSSS